ncbi:hypothetical protein W97_07682 [Coniosporium apollinis CBS 100218]|uniref:Glycosyl hydrolase family 13 catalytic domain-containing protein n=1 Tax=Coniosporium apollinis (strain CBS 100218) TaxID=1168221 RepID=R7Z2T4_CONA1|nr:uncharacterized protein W97_07682 [Coniosporium apollinis CBS 100218]EON68472.1 hypothetical protein W97_07682 [Coniosporium apollinis CBS 100218]
MGSIVNGTNGVSRRQRKYWQDATVYQIYPASFKDSNGDGMGDLQGIISKLDYIKELGVDVIWVCPMYDSPQVDMGYDISDYESVYPPYGTVHDMEELIEGTHKRGMKIILDLVINHTSDQHAWFKESRSSKESEKRDWYIWRPAKYDADGNRRPPNNWRSEFGGSAWEWDEGSQEYYLHLFEPQQPDLNFENEEARKAIYASAIEFWLERGVDGFRVDTVNMYSKHQEFVDAPIKDETSFFQKAADFYCNGPYMHDYLSEIYAILEKYDAFTVGELPHTPDPAHILRYVSAEAKQLNMVFQFDVVNVGLGPRYKYDSKPYNWALPEFKKALSGTQILIDDNDGWTTAFLENHDQARSITRFVTDKPEFRVQAGKMLAIMLSAFSGTLYLYQGQEIGMVNIPKDWPIEEYKDIDALKYYKFVSERTNGNQAELDAALESLNYFGRDNARTPMQWDDSPHGGFTSGKKPWMRVNDSFHEINVAQQQKDKDSTLAFWKKMLKLRKEYNDVFIHGNYKVHDMESPSTYIFTKSHNGQQVLVLLNFTEKEQEYSVPSEVDGKLELLVSSADSTEGPLKPYEGRLYLVS